MKKYYSIALASVAALAVLASCEKEVPSPEEEIVPGTSEVTPQEPVKEQVTITASMPVEGLTKVTLSQDGTDKKLIKLAWEDDDVININGKTFTIVPATITNEGKTASFTGTAPDPVGGKYNISYADLPGTFATQTQSADGNTDHLGYAVALTGASDYASFEFSESSATALGATLSQSSVLSLRALLPDGIAATVQKVIFKASENVFDGGNTLTVNIGTPGDDGSDNLLKVYATLPAGDVNLAADMDLLIQFQVSANAYDKYTAYRQFASGKDFILSGKTQYLGLNCSNIDKYAGSADDGTAAHPYLIADQHQMNAMHDLMERASTKYFKLIDDVNMTGIVWFPLNNGYPKVGGDKYTGNVYDKALDFNGNHKTISFISTNTSSPTTSEEYASIFGVLMGNVYDLTIDHATITPKGKSGILAGYVGTGAYGPAHCEVRNVIITNSSVTGSDSYCGVLAGQSAKNNNVFSNISINECTVSSTGYASGLVAYFANSATVSDITVSNTNVTSSGDTNSYDPAGDGFAGGISARLNAAVDFDRCTFSDGTIIGPAQANNDNSKKNRFVGGLVAYVSNVAASFDDCHVSNASLGLPSAPATNNGRYIGGAFGYLGAAATVGNTTGCSVTGLSMNTNVRNYIAGFVSFLDGGTIKNSSAASTSAIGNSTYSGAAGGFVGYANGGTLYNNSSSVSITGAGNPGGFIGWVETAAATFEKCTASGSITAGSNNAGGFCGIDKIGSTYIECSSSGVVNGTGYVGGLIGFINADGATITKCYSTSTVTGSGNYVGGLIGVAESDTIEKSYYNGTVTGNSRVGGILGIGMKDDATIIRNCYSRGAVVGSSSEQRFGGIVGDLGKGGSVTNCWSDSDITGGRVLGGIVGLACYQTWADATVANNTVTGCIAWNSKVSAAQAGDYGSSAAIVGHTSFTNVLSNCYRRSDMDYKNSNNTLSSCITAQVDQPDSDGTNWVAGTTPGTTASSNQNPYYGVAKDPASFTVKSIAKDIIGWSSDVWDFTADFPTLK